MRKLMILVFSFALIPAASGQQNLGDTPASKEDVQRYFDVMHFHAQMENVMRSMSGFLKGRAHEECAKQKDQSQQDCEATVDKRMSLSLKQLPIEEMIQAMMPIMQKHMTKADVDAFIDFYSSPTGQKMMREQPQMMSEMMQAMKPILDKRVETMQKEMDEQMAEMKKQSGPNSSPSKPKN
jgi:hypothetical protein